MDNSQISLSNENIANIFDHEKDVCNNTQMQTPTSHRSMSKDNLINSCSLPLLLNQYSHDYYNSFTYIHPCMFPQIPQEPYRLHFPTPLHIVANPTSNYPSSMLSLAISLNPSLSQSSLNFYNYLNNSISPNYTTSLLTPKLNSPTTQVTTTYDNPNLSCSPSQKKRLKNKVSTDSTKLLKSNQVDDKTTDTSLPSSNLDDIPYISNTLNDSHEFSTKSNKAYACPHPSCKMKFDRKYNLKTHYATHFDIRVHTCTFCKMLFSRKYDKLRHQKLIHSFNPQKS